MPCLVRRSNGIYYHVVTINGHRVWKSTGCKNKIRVLQKVNRVKEERDQRSSPTSTLKEFAVPLFAYLQTNLAPSTVQLRRSKQLRMIKTRPVYFTAEEFKTLLAAVTEPWYRDMLLFAISTMMRLCEIVNLKWKSVDLERRIISIENTEGFHVKTYQHGRRLHR